MPIWDLDHSYCWASIYSCLWGLCLLSHYTSEDGKCLDQLSSNSTVFANTPKAKADFKCLTSLFRFPNSSDLALKFFILIKSSMFLIKFFQHFAQLCYYLLWQDCSQFPLPSFSKVEIHIRTLHLFHLAGMLYILKPINI